MIYLIIIDLIIGGYYFTMSYLLILLGVAIIIKEVRLNTILKLFLMNTPTIKIEKIDKDKNTSGNIMNKLLIIIN